MVVSRNGNRHCNPFAQAAQVIFWSRALPVSIEHRELSVGCVRRRPVLMLLILEVRSRIAISLFVAMATVVAAMPGSARSCILSNVPSERACKPACCANKTCCKTSDKNTAAPSQPLAKGDCAQPLNAISFAAAAPALPSCETAREQMWFQLRTAPAHSPPPLALICIRLI